jgi:hypothetical protein
MLLESGICANMSRDIQILKIALAATISLLEGIKHNVGGTTCMD